MRACWPLAHQCSQLSRKSAPARSLGSFMTDPDTEDDEESSYITTDYDPNSASSDPDGGESEFVVDWTPEAYAAKAFDLPFRLGREGRVSSSDPSCHQELFAGRRIFGHKMLTTNKSVEIGVYPLLEELCDHKEDEQDTSMGASPCVSLRLYKPKQKPDNEEQLYNHNSTYPWLLMAPPQGYNASLYHHYQNDHYHRRRHHHHCNDSS